MSYRGTVQATLTPTPMLAHRPQSRKVPPCIFAIYDRLPGIDHRRFDDDASTGAGSGSGLLSRSAAILTVVSWATRSAPTSSFARSMPCGIDSARWPTPCASEARMEMAPLVISVSETFVTARPKRPVSDPIVACNNTPRSARAIATRGSATTDAYRSGCARIGVKPAIWISYRI